jgi:FMN-dependent NADH-azoreductase
MKLLHIIASPRGEKSRTLNISNVVLEGLHEKNANLSVDNLDLFKVLLPEIQENSVDAKYAVMQGANLKEESVSPWNEIVKISKEFMSYDAYLISCPMWNFTIPYKLKHYIDIIMQPGILFRFTEKGVEGLALNKKMYCITSRGSDYSKNSPLHQYDFQEPYLRSIFGLAGIYDISFINAQPMDFSPDITIANIDKAKVEANALAHAV